MPEVSLQRLSLDLAVARSRSVDTFAAIDRNQKSGVKLETLLSLGRAMVLLALYSKELKLYVRTKPAHGCV